MTPEEEAAFHLLVVALSVDENLSPQTRIMAKVFLKSGGTDE